MSANKSSTPRLEILLLGPPVIQYKNQPYQITRRMLRGMLFFLAVENRLISRNKLILTFWPEANEEDGRRHLRESLSKLRKALPDENALIIEHDGVLLNTDLIQVDLALYRTLLSGPQQVIHAIHEKLLPAPLVGNIENALKLWRAPRFMAGMNLPDSSEFQSWQSAKAQEMEHSELFWINKLTDHYMAAGNYFQALLRVRKGLLIDELDSGLYQKQIESLYAMDRAADALNVLEQLKQHYQEERFGELPVSLVNLENRIKREIKDYIFRDPSKWLEPIDLHSPYVGHKDLLVALQDAYSHGRTAFLKGEAGSGKTRLAYEVYNRLAPSPRLILVSGKASEKNKPFQAWIDLLRRNLKSTDWERLDQVWLNQLVNLLPELSEFQRPSQISEQPVVFGEGQTGIFEAIRRVILMLIEENNLFICLDDTQWFDNASMEVNNYLFAHDNAPSKGLVLITSRLEEESKALVDLEMYCVQEHHAKSMILEPLTTDDVRDLASAMLDLVPSARLVRKLEADTGGNPLLLLETMKSMTALEKNPRQLNRISTLPVAPSIQNLLHQRLQLLNTDARTFLQCAALVGRQFLVADIANIAEIKLEQAVDAVEELQRINLIKPLTHSAAQADYTFIHDKIRETISISISLARQRMLHLRIGYFIERKYHASFEMSSTIAQHFQEAGEVVAACNYWIKAAVYANQKLSPELSKTACRNAERLLVANESMIPIEMIHYLYDILGQVYYLERNKEELRRNAEKLITFGKKRESALLLVAGYSMYANLETLLVQPVKALEYLEKAAPYINKLSNLTEESLYYNRRGLAYQLMLDLEHAEQDYRKSIALCQDIDKREIIGARIDGNSKLAFLTLFQGWPEKVLEYTRRVIEDCNAIGDIEKSVWAHFMSSAAHIDMGNNRAAVLAAREGLMITDAYHSHQFAGYLRLALGRAQFLLGEVEPAWELMEAVMHETEGKFPDVQIEAFLAQIQSYEHLAAFQPAYSLAEQGWNKFEGMLQRPMFLAHMGFTKGYLGDLQKGLEMIDQSVQMIEPTGMMPNLINCRLMRGNNYKLLGDLKKALLDLNWVFAECAQRNYWTFFSVCCKALGESAILMKDPEGAYEYALKFLQRSRQTNNPWLEIMSLRLKNEVSRSLGDHDVTLKPRLTVLLDMIERTCVRPQQVSNFRDFKQFIFQSW